MPLTKNTNIVVVPAKNAQETNDIKKLSSELEKPTLVERLFYYSDWSAVFWLISSVIFLIAAFTIYKKYFKKAKPPVIPITPPHVRAKQRIEMAKRYIGDPRKFCFEISAALRAYLEERFSLRASEQTTEEFLCDLQMTPLLTKDQKAILADFLNRCDLVKFARYEPPEKDLIYLLEVALKLVDETTPYGEGIEKVGIQQPASV
ncbi:MAG: hypothetical protein ACP5K7_10635 [Verrucomicrobiia bacterium]